MRRSEEVLHTFQHHAELLAGVQTRVQALFDATEHMSALDSKREDLVEFLRRRVLPHAELEEHTFYEIGSHYEPTRLLVTAMQSEHVRLTDMIEHLDQARSTLEVLRMASAMLALFESHLEKENEVLIPELSAAQLM
jgi:hemerythrin-like domain-containing protein